MKIVHIITGLNTGGAETALYNLLESGMATEFDCHVISLMGLGTMGPKIAKLGVPVTALGIQGRLPFASLLIRLRRVIRDEDAHLIQGWMYHGNLAASLACLFSRNKPLLSWNIRHCLHDFSGEKWLTKQIIRLNSLVSRAPDILLYNSYASKKQHENFGFSETNGVVIQNGINVDRYVYKRQDRYIARSELSIPDSAVVVGHVARLHPIKGHLSFIGAAVSLAKEDDDLHFVMCGKEVVPSNSMLASLVPANMRNRFHFLGERSNIEELMCSMDIFVSSSKSEAFSNVIGEAMSCEIPCVATDVGDSSMIVSDYGVIVPPNNELALATGINHLVSMGNRHRRTAGALGREHIISKFSLRSSVGRYSKLYSGK